MSMTAEAMAARHTCLKLEITEPVFVKGMWFDSHFHLSVTDGLNAWVCDATEEQVKERAGWWDQPVTEYINLAERYLGFQHPGSVYRFTDAGDLSFTFEKEGIKLDWRWKCKPSPDNKKTTAGILNFLLDANTRLSEEVVTMTRSLEQLKEEADKCLKQSEKFAAEKVDFESSVYSKFLAVLNTKKQKLRELRDQLSEKKSSGKLAQEEEEESTDKTDDGSDDDKSEEDPSEKLTGTSKDVPLSSRGRGRKRTTRK